MNQFSEALHTSMGRTYDQIKESGSCWVHTRSMGGRTLWAKTFNSVIVKARLKEIADFMAHLEQKL